MTLAAVVTTAILIAFVLGFVTAAICMSIKEEDLWVSQAEECARRMEGGR